MLVRMVKVSLDGCFAATILLYPAPTGQDTRGGILMLVRMVKFSLDGCLAATILSNPAPTGSSTYDKVQKSALEVVKKALI